ncbi:ABC transporter ATP-binding protein [Acuticoccus sp. I52.16.1]|uniref:ABC transporter ATP-binding protein n=1 Tax=Acuticoccus sp. I52.16.1 TaxID=2928472 RepID=UPI001FD3012C|nr:ABC transporter ATP-binding protein [Acuticoccus sp. I52.16.1]UOM34376.1 ABC transporter ATP-binding protein [Acuticoccus sp. I52.16.1]
MSRLDIQGLHKFYGSMEALKGIDLTVPEGEFCVFVGPSGCGKSTLLRTIAGLEEVSKGTIAIDGEVVNDLRPRDRNIAMVFQNYALYPYLSVFENIAFGLRARKAPDAEVKWRVGEAAEMLGISQLLARQPRQLSGGQRQRVAIGRAVVRDARLFLFDEPLSNLDAQLRDGMRAEIKRLHGEIGKTTIYVTHDQIEAMTLADRIVLLRDGRIEQQGPPLELFERPKTRFVAGFLGSPQMNFLPVTLEGDAIRLADGQILPCPPQANGATGAMVLGIRPEHLSRAGEAAPAPGKGQINALIDLVQPTGTRTYTQFRIGDVEVTAELPAHTVERPGAQLPLTIDMARTTLFDADGRALGAPQ